MKYWKNITIDLPEIDLGAATDKLIDLNVLSITIKDKRREKDSDWYDDMVEPISFSSDTHQISLLVDGEEDIDVLMNIVRKILCLDEPLSYVEEVIQDQDWEVHTQDKFTEIIISDNMRVIPPWVSKPNFNGITIIIEPGSGFGVGTHPTTQLCLDWLESRIEVGDSLLDYGSGSGILSIAAKKLGAAYVAGIELDQRAIRNSMHNSTLNDLEIDFHNSNDHILGKKYDHVIANILSGTLIDLSPKFKSHANKRLALSGILIDQADKVINAFSEWIDLKPHSKKEGWVLLDGVLHT